MIDLLLGFVAELREAGLPVSMVETVDAASALRHVDMADRNRLKAALGATLVKNERHVEAFETVFETYFALRGPTAGSAPAEARLSADMAAIGSGGAAGGGDAEVSDLVSALFRAVRDDDRALLEAVVRVAVDRLSGMEPGRPVGGAHYLYRILRRLDLEALSDRLEGTLESTHTDLERRLQREEIDARLEAFRAALRSEIRRRLVADRGPEAVARTLRRPLLEDVDLTTATRDDLARLERAVHPLGRRLAVRLSRRRRQGSRGRLDVRRTLRRSLSTGGVPVEPQLRRPRPGKPELVLLCDISGSVATYARFTMQLVAAISAQFTRVRSFAFIDAIDEVTAFFGPGVDFDEAMRRIGTEAGVVWLDGHSDYGNAFGSFVEHHLDSLGPRATVVVIGDARTNFHDPNTAALERIAAATRALYWLNPERRRHWDTGDSVMGSYLPSCDEVHEVRNLRQLEWFVERVALPRAPNALQELGARGR